MPKIIQKALAILIGSAVTRYNQKKRVAKHNIQLCFPSLSSAEGNELVSQNGHHIGKSFIEWCKAWFWSDAQMKRYFRHRVEGLEILNKAKNSGVLLIVKHTAHFYVDARVLGLYKDYGIVVKTIGYSDQLDDAYVDAVKRAARLGVAKSDQPMRIARWLKSGEVVAYAADQDFGIDNSVICDFFGVPTATISAPYKLQKAYKCRVCYLNSYYDESGTFVLSIHELSGLDQEDPTKFMQQINNTIASGIRKHPNQYLWSYDRFRSFTTQRLLLSYNVCASEHPTYQRIVNLLKYKLRDIERHSSFINDIRISGLVVNEKLNKVLVLRLRRPWKKESEHLWFTLGDLHGKTPDATNIAWIALLKARKISGIKDMCVLSTDIFDIDVEVYKSGNFNIRYLLQADCNYPLRQIKAPWMLEWVDLATPQIKCPSFIRLANKTRAYLAENANLAATT